MDKYHKIQTVWKRDPETNYKTLIHQAWAKPEFEYLQFAKWEATEKVDGTNIRVMWDGEAVSFRGRTDKAQIPVFLVEKLKQLFDRDLMANHFIGPACLYGEGYGAKIQKGGGDYIRNGVDFILFDVLANNIWWQREDVEDIARSLGIGFTPTVCLGNLHDCIEFAKSGYQSFVAKDSKIAEGLIMRPSVELTNRLGERVITKIKYRDFPND